MFVDILTDENSELSENDVDIQLDINWVEKEDVVELLDSGFEDVDESDIADILDSGKIDGFCNHSPVSFNITYPLNNAIGISLTPTLVWEESEDFDPQDVVKYTVQISQNFNFTSLVHEKTDIDTTNYIMPSGLLDYSQTYFLRVIATDKCESPNKTYSRSIKFTTISGPNVCDNPPSAFDLTTPPNKIEDISLTPSFDWSNATDPDPGDSVIYRLQVATDQQFLNIVLDKASLASSNYTVLPQEALSGDTHYYWRAIAEDSCSQQTYSTSVFDFTTLHVPNVCDNAPTSFNLNEPAPNAVNVSLTPNFAWQASSDPDPQDTVYYTLQITQNNNFNNPLFSIGVGQTTSHTLTTPLQNSTTYQWRVVAEDACIPPNRTISAVREFTTVPQSCNPGSFTDTDFTTGAHSDTVALNGTLSVAEDYDAWTEKYEAFDPPELEGWIEEAPSGWTVKEANSGVLHLSTIGKDNFGNYTRNTSFNNTIGNVVEARMRLVSSEGEYGCTLEIHNGTKNLTFLFFSDHVREDGIGLEASFDTTSSFNTYRVTQKGQDFYLYANGQLLIDGTGMSGLGTTFNRIRFNDQSLLNDSESYWDYIYSYNGGDILPKKASGSYLSQMINLGSQNNNLGSGATLNFNGSGNLSFDIFSSNNTTLPATPCATGLNVSGSTIPGTCSGQYAWIRANLNNSDATLMDFTLNYCIQN